jgi:hypothetical protein
MGRGHPGGRPIWEPPFGPSFGLCACPQKFDGRGSGVASLLPCVGMARATGTVPPAGPFPGRQRHYLPTLYLMSPIGTRANGGQPRQHFSEFDALREDGVTHFLPQPPQGTLADRLRSIVSEFELMKSDGASLEVLAS